MNAQETLAQIDHIMTEVDLVVYEWQEAVDMMSFIGSNAQFAMWTDEIPPRVVTAKNIGLLPLQGIHEVRVMHFTEDGWAKVGTAKIGVDGNFIATIDREVPGLTDIKTDFSVSDEGALFSLPAKKGVDWDIDNNIPLKDNPAWNPPFEGLNKPLTIRGLEKIIDEIDDKIERHPFFRTESGPDKHEER